MTIFAVNMAKMNSDIGRVHQGRSSYALCDIYFGHIHKHFFAYAKNVYATAAVTSRVTRIFARL
jgi:hypothetical protein